MDDLRSDDVSALLTYDPLTGKFRWAVDKTTATGRSKLRGKLAGNRRPDGYVSIRLRGRRYLAHRLAWLLTHGKWPLLSLDHINGDPGDNRIANLRGASPCQSAFNRGAHSDNRAGLKGVSLRKRGRWSAVIVANKKKHYLGSFDTPEAAHAAYCDAAQLLHGRFARTA